MNWFLCLQLTRASPRPGIRTVRSTRPNSANHPVCPNWAVLQQSLIGSLASARQGRPRERADPTTDTGCRIEKVGLLPFSVGRPVSGVQSGVVRQFFANRKMLINQSGLAHVTVN